MERIRNIEDFVATVSNLDEKPSSILTAINNAIRDYASESTPVQNK